jgi:glycosyltransferase involved in cell wall biosynthesis
LIKTVRRVTPVSYAEGDESLSGRVTIPNQEQGELSSQSKNWLPEIAVIIPAFNEADSITKVLDDIPKGLVSEVVVVDNNSTDATSEKARQAGATVLSEPRQGYGFACLKGVDYLKSRSKNPDIVVFLDADYSDYPEEMASLLTPIIEQDCDLVIGARSPGKRGKGAMPPHQPLGNWLAITLIRLIHGVKFTDLGPFRAIKFDKLIGLDMKDRTYGWPIEMQLKAVKQGLRIGEVPVSYRARIGKSKVSGSVKGSILAGYKIIATIFRYR